MAQESILTKCSEWGNAFIITMPEDGKRVAHPACEAECKAFVKDCQVQMKPLIYEDDDHGKL